MNVKATTGEGIGFVGRGEGVAALAIASLAARARRRAMREIRLHDTRSGELLPLRPRDPGTVGIYACGPTVYSRIHIGNARPFVVFSLLKRFLEHEGYETTLVVNVTDVNDKIYDAARAQGRPSAELAQEMTERYLADTDALGLGRPDHEPLASETIASIVDYIADADRHRARLCGGGRCLLPRALGLRLRVPVAPADRGHGPGRGYRGVRAQGGSAGLRAVEGAQGGRGHLVGRALGAGSPGLAHRVLGDGRGCARRRLRHPRRRLGPAVSPPRERGRPDPRRARGGAGADLDAQRHDPVDRREDGQVGRQHRAAARGARAVRARRRRHVPDLGGHYRQPLAFSRGGAGAGRRPTSSRIREAAPPARSPGRARPIWLAAARARSSTRSPTTSTPRWRSRTLFEWIREADRRGAEWAMPTCARCSASWAWRV